MLVESDDEQRPAPFLGVANTVVDLGNELFGQGQVMRWVSVVGRQQIREVARLDEAVRRQVTSRRVLRELREETEPVDVLPELGEGQRLNRPGFLGGSFD